MCVCVLLTIEILFNITEATCFWAIDKCMSMLYPILRKQMTMTNWVIIVFEFKWYLIHGVA